MAAVTSAVIGTGVAIHGQQQQSKAAKSAAQGIERANIQNAEMLRSSTLKGQSEIQDAQALAAQTIGDAYGDATGFIEPYVQPGLEAYSQAEDLIMGGGPIGGPLADSIRAAGEGGINSRIYDREGIEGEIARQGDVAVSGLTPSFRDQLLTAGGQGLAASADVGSIKSRGLDMLSDIAGATGAQRASLLVGSGPQFQQLSSGADEARLMGNVAGQRATTQGVESLAKLAGRLA